MSTDIYKFAELVRAMRTEQAAYFRTRSPERLIEAARLERRVDLELRGILEPRPMPLFPDREEAGP